VPTKTPSHDEILASWSVSSIQQIGMARFNLTIRRPLHLLPVLIVLFGGANGSIIGQDSGGSSTTQTLTLSVLDNNDKFVRNIHREQILLTGVRATVAALELDTAPRRVLLLLDTSGSMGNYKSLSWANVVDFATRFALQRKDKGDIRLDTFATTHEVQIPFTSDVDLVAKHISTLRNSGSGTTMLGQTLTEILAERANPLRFGDTIVLVSDGDRSSADKTDFRQLRDDLTRAGIRISLIRVQGICGPCVMKGVSDIAEFVKSSGGIEFKTTNPVTKSTASVGQILNGVTLTSTLQAVQEFIDTYYRLVLQPADSLLKPHDLQLAIVDSQNRKIRGLRLNYPQHLLPAARY
jgi:hypothetical protein